jgi:hypothetical protein
VFWKVNSPPHLPYNPVKYFISNYIEFAINKYSLKKSPEFDLITTEVARFLPKKAFIHLSHIINSSKKIIIISHAVEIFYQHPNAQT